MAAEIVLGLLGLLGDLRGQDVVGERGLVSPVIFGETPDVVEVTGHKEALSVWHLAHLGTCTAQAHNVGRVRHTCP